MLAFGDYILDRERRELRYGSEAVDLEPQVFDLLLYLIQNRGRVVTKDDLISSVWNGRIVSESTLTSRLAAVRKAVGDSGRRQSFVRTYPRRGVRFVGEVRDRSDAIVDGAAGEGEGARPGRSALTILDGTEAQPGYPVGSAPVVPWGGKPAVAVLPFRNLSGESGQDRVSDGITEDIMTVLSRCRSLAVIARNSSSAFNGPGDVREVGRRLGAEYLVEGSIRETGRHLRVSVDLAETERGQQLWAATYDRELGDPLAAQDEITAAIAARVEPEVDAAERFRAERRALPALHAWGLSGLGTKGRCRCIATDNAEAERLLRRAIARDPWLSEAAMGARRRPRKVSAQPAPAPVRCRSRFRQADQDMSFVPTMEGEMLVRIGLGAVAAALAVTGGAAQQLPAATQQTQTIKRTPLQKFDVPGTTYETVTGIAEISPNVTIGRHTHPGPESGYMMEGEMVLMIQGQPDRTVKSGESYQVPSGAVHDAKAGSQGAKVLATYVVEKGKPLASPAR